MKTQQCFDEVKNCLDLIIKRTKNQAMEKPRLLRILLRLMADNENFPDYQTALDSPRLKVLYKEDPYLTSGYGTVSGELIQTYFRKIPRFADCFFQGLKNDNFKNLFDYLDKNRRKFLSASLKSKIEEIKVIDY